MRDSTACVLTKATCAGVGQYCVDALCASMYYPFKEWQKRVSIREFHGSDMQNASHDHISPSIQHAGVLLPVET